MAARIVKLEKAIDEAVRQAPAEIRAVIEALQALRGVAQTTAASIVSELGSLSRFPEPAAVDGLQRPGGERTLQRQSGAARRDHQDRQRSPQTGDGGSGMGVSASAECDRFSAAEAEEPGDQRGSARRSPGRRNSGCTNATRRWRRAARTRTRSWRRSDANCWVSSGRSRWQTEKQQKLATAA